MRRREFIGLLGGAVAWPMVARAQQPVIGFLHQGSPATYPHVLTGIRQGLKETGFVEGSNIEIEYRWANGQYDLLPRMAVDLVQRRVRVITASLLPAAQAAMAATTTIPIVFHIGSDPVKVGLVSNMNRPGGNLTGAGRLTVELGPKRLELLREVVPSATVVAFLVNPTNPNADTITKDAQQAARSMGLQLPVWSAASASEIDAAFSAMAQQRVDALLVGSDAFFHIRAAQFVVQTSRHAIPAIYSSRSVAEAGGLMSYAAVQSDLDRNIGIYIGRILNGEKAGDLPVQQATKVELVINMQTAKALGLTVPLPLLGRADEVIE